MIWQNDNEIKFNLKEGQKVNEEKQIRYSKYLVISFALIAVLIIFFKLFCGGTSGNNNDVQGTVQRIAGDNLFRAKNEAGEYELVTLTVGDFESILLKSALLQQSAYNRFKQARDAVNKYKRADKIFSVEF